MHIKNFVIILGFESANVQEGNGLLDFSFDLDPVPINAKWGSCAVRFVPS